MLSEGRPEGRTRGLDAASASGFNFQVLRGQGGRMAEPAAAPLQVTFASIPGLRSASVVSIGGSSWLNCQSRLTPGIELSSMVLVSSYAKSAILQGFVETRDRGN